MAAYYISTARGSDSNTSIQAQNPATPWKTIGKALGTSGGAAGSVVAGDTVFVEPGVYRELIKLSAAGSSGSAITVVGDVDGSNFRTGGYSTPATGEVQVTPYTTNDRTQCGTTATINLNGKGYYTFQDLSVIGSRATMGAVDGYSTATNNITLKNCYFSAPTTICVGAFATDGVALNWTVDSCIFVGYNWGLQFSVPFSATAEWNLATAVRNCIFHAVNSGGLNIAKYGGAVNNRLGYGFTVQGCTFFMNVGVSVYTGQSSAMANTVAAVKNCNFINYYAFQAGANNYIFEDYNISCSSYYQSGGINGGTTAGAHSQGWQAGSQQYDPMLEFGQALFWGGQARPFLMPAAGSPYLNFGDGTTPSYDLAGRNRPEGN